MRRFQARLAPDSRGRGSVRFQKLAALSLCATLGCESGTSPDRLPVMVAILTPAGDTLRSLGDSAILTLDVRDGSGARRALIDARWRTLDGATVVLLRGGPDGAILRATSNGTSHVEVEARYGTGAQDISTVRSALTVQQRPSRLALDVRGMPPASSYGSALTLSLGSVIELVATPLDGKGNVVPATLVATDASPSFASDDNSLAEVTNAGVLRGNRVGTTVIRATLRGPWGVILGALPVAVGLRSP